MPTANDIVFMTRALELARTAAEEGEVPVGALVVHNGQVVGEGWNRPVSSADPSAHAEIVALRQAAAALENYRLPECTLYVTLEPCTMCVGAMIHGRIARVVYGATEPKAGVVESNGCLPQAAYFNHRLAFEGGVCAAQSAALLQAFFRERRGG